MKKYNLIFLFILTIVCSDILIAQELIKKKKVKDGITNEFYVLKDNKEIKQGPFLSTYLDVFDKKYIADFGQYEQDAKTGTWLSFYYKNPSNFLKSSGEFKDNKKVGDWQYYFPGLISKANILSLFGSEKRTNIVSPKKGDIGFKIELDTSGLSLMCEGQYTDDVKSGVWEYYSKSGFLLHQYNHSSHEMMQNYLRDPQNNFLTFLGGPERFYNFYFTAQQEINQEISVIKTSEVIYEIDKNGNYIYVQAFGDISFKNNVDKILETIPNEWIWLKQNATQKLQLISKVLYNENSFMKYSFSLDFKVIN